LPGNGGADHRHAPPPRRRPRVVLFRGRRRKGRLSGRPLLLRTRGKPGPGPVGKKLAFPADFRRSCWRPGGPGLKGEPRSWGGTGDFLAGTRGGKHMGFHSAGVAPFQGGRIFRGGVALAGGSGLRVRPPGGARNNPGLCKTRTAQSAIVPPWADGKKQTGRFGFWRLFTPGGGDRQVWSGSGPGGGQAGGFPAFENAKTGRPFIRPHRPARGWGQWAHGQKKAETGPAGFLTGPP